MDKKTSSLKTYPWVIDFITLQSSILYFGGEKNGEKELKNGKQGNHQGRADQTHPGATGTAFVLWPHIYRVG